MKLLPAKGFLERQAQYNIRFWAEEVPEGFTVEDLLVPTAWKHHAKKLERGDIIFAVAVDGSFDIGLRVIDLTHDGVIVRLWPTAVQAAPVEEGELSPQRMLSGKLVPRVEYTKATKWRVIGLDGNEISREHETKDEARDELERYAAVHRIEVGG